MEQTDYTMLAMLQNMTRQMQQPDVTAALQSNDSSSFQKLMRDRSQTTNDSSQSQQKTEAPSKEQPAANVKKTDDKDEQELAQELACAQLVAAEANPVVSIQTEEQQAVPVLEIASTPVTEELTDSAVQTLASSAAEETPLSVDEQPKEQTTAVQDTEIAAVSDETTEAPVQQTTDDKAQTNTQENDLASDTQEDTPEAKVTEAPAAQPQPVFQHVQTHMIKVGETAKADSTNDTTDVGQQIAEQITGALDNGDTKVQVQLSPRSLGDVTVEITQQKDGALHIVLTAENTHTRALLGQHTESLQGLLSGQTQKPVQVEVSRSQEQQQQSQSYDGKNGSQQNPQEQQHRQNKHNEDFLQQLRLGLIPFEVETT
jgi:flagellar hook-length control protein FliK